MKLKLPSNSLSVARSLNGSVPTIPPVKAELIERMQALSVAIVEAAEILVRTRGQTPFEFWTTQVDCSIAAMKEGYNELKIAHNSGFIGFDTLEHFRKQIETVEHLSHLVIRAQKLTRDDEFSGLPSGQTQFQSSGK